MEKYISPELTVVELEALNAFCILEISSYDVPTDEEPYEDEWS